MSRGSAQTTASSAPRVTSSATGVLPAVFFFFLLRLFYYTGVSVLFDAPSRLRKPSVSNPTGLSEEGNNETVEACRYCSRQQMISMNILNFKAPVNYAASDYRFLGSKPTVYVIAQKGEVGEPTRRYG